MTTIALFLERTSIRSHRVIKGVLQFADEHPDLRLCDYLFESDHVEDYEHATPPWVGRVDGVVASSSKIDHLVDWLKRGKVPIVMACGDLAASGVLSVFTDSQSIAEIAGNHIRSIGRSHVGFVGYQNSDGSLRRQNSLAQFCKKQGFSFMACEMEAYLPISHTKEAELIEPEPDLLKMLAKLPKPAVVVTLNDHYAIATLNAIQSLGFSVPEDIALIGVDDSESSRLFSTPITSVHPPSFQIGYESTRLLMRMIEGKRLARKIVEIPAERISVRESTVGQRRAPVTDIDRAKEYIRRHACEGIRVVDVADHVHIPLRTFQIEFKEQTGSPVTEEIRRVRFNRACELLQTTDFTLERIAHLVGMSHAASFSEFFRRTAGMTPNSYRDKNEQD